jgi:hypothetical protein
VIPRERLLLQKNKGKKMRKRHKISQKTMEQKRTEEALT